MSPSTPDWLRNLRPRRSEWRRDALAGLPNAISSVPDGMASSLLAGVPPVHGLYASAVGPIAGGLTTSTRMMVITTTSAAALAAGSALASVRPTAGRGHLVAHVADRTPARRGGRGPPRALRAFRVAVGDAGIASPVSQRTSSWVRSLTSSEQNRPAHCPRQGRRGILFHPGRIDGWSAVAGAGALVLLFCLARTRLSMLSSLLALAVPTLLLLLVDQDVARVRDSRSHPGRRAPPRLSGSPAMSPEVVAGAIAVAAIILIQGAGVAEAAPNPDGSRSRTNRDFAAQGVATSRAASSRGCRSVAAVGSTALNVSAGAVSRWGAIWSGIWMLIVLVAFSGVVGQVLMPTLSAVLVFAAIMSLKPHEIWTIAHAGPTPLVAMFSTFAATLLLPVAAAVGVGVTLSLILQLNQESIDLRIVEASRRRRTGHRTACAPEPRARPGRRARRVRLAVLRRCAHLAAAAADPAGADGASVILRLRGRHDAGATFFTVIASYAQVLHRHGGTLYLTGVEPSLLRLSGARRTDLPLRRHQALPGPARARAATPRRLPRRSSTPRGARRRLHPHRGDVRPVPEDRR
ncbi:SulP family inorganic anion transporter [Aeromicrobium sp. UC242_57]|uniref:SulP family inorganic anion transporter n=1 Tax=Aeromicrobium sp. UC242_57 TaxID=3374624 RepID=UPI0037AEF624